MAAAARFSSQSHAEPNWIHRSHAMAKGQQRSNKEAKKPKKDASSKPVSPTTVMPTITTAIMERGKKKNK
jgi:hypothetical protein